MTSHSEEISSTDQTQVRGRWVGEALYWDINGETITEEALRQWCWDNLPEDSLFRSKAGITVAYHTRAWANRRRAIGDMMRTLTWS
jgi:hypothetical protein